MRIDVIKRVTGLVADIWPKAKVEVYGSQVTDLCVPYSDVDLVIFGTKEYCDTLSALFTLANELENRGICYQATVISTCKVPIIKFKDYKSGCLVDVTFDCKTGTQNSSIIMNYLAQYPLLKPLILFIKYYLKQRNLNDTWSGGIGSYTLVLMITSFLQLHTEHHGRNDNDNLALLLIKFFELYGKKFDYLNHTISVLDGGKYLTKESKKWDNETSPELLSVEDPFDTDIDLGASSFCIQYVKNSFEQAYEKLNNLLNNQQTDFISEIIFDTMKMKEYRDRIKSLYGDNNIQSPSPSTNKRNRPCSYLQRHNYFRGTRTTFNQDTSKNGYDFPELLTQPIPKTKYRNKQE